MRRPHLTAPRFGLLAAACFLVACGRSEAPPQPAAPAQTPPASEPAPTAPTAPASAIALLAATEGNAVGGEVRFRIHDGHVVAEGRVHGLPAGSRHGFHIHETGDCSAPDAMSAGGHFNPGGAEHGRQGHGSHHLGDMDNLVAGDDGVAIVDQHLQGVEIGTGSAVDIVGRGLIVHADPDDYETQPTGNAGARLACAVIALQE